MEKTRKKTIIMKNEDRQDFMEYLQGKKNKDGKLSKIGEWLLSGKSKELGWKVSPGNMKYILK